MMSEEQTKYLSDIFEKFVDGKRIAIISPSGKSRSTVLKIFVEMNIQSKYIDTYSSYFEAQEKLSDVGYADAPCFVVSEFDLNGRYCSDLFLKLKKTNQCFTETGFFIMSNDSKETNVIKALESEIDGFIIKPFTIQLFKEKILRTSLVKSKPSPYAKLINQAKSLMVENDYSEAMNLLLNATVLHPRPAVACQLIGDIHKHNEEYDKAMKWYKSGLKNNKLNLFCLTGLFDLFYDMHEYKSALKIIQKMNELFPLSPERLGKAIQVASELNQYDELLMYFEYYKEVDKKDPFLVREMVHALAKAARFYYGRNAPANGQMYLENGIVASRNQVNHLRYLCEVMVDFKEFNLINKAISRCDDGDRKTPDFKVMTILFLLEDERDDVVIQKCYQAISSGIKDIKIFEILIKLLMRNGKSDTAEQVLDSAISEFPEYQDHLNTII